MSFKDNSYLELWSGVESFFAISVILLNDFEFGPVVQEMPFNVTSYI